MFLLIQVAIVGNKIDLRDKALSNPGKYNLKNIVSTDEANSIQDMRWESLVGIYEASAKERTGVDKAFSEAISQAVQVQLDNEKMQVSCDPEPACRKKTRKIFKIPKAFKGEGVKMSKMAGCKIM